MRGGDAPDASRITPPIALEGTRAGHDVSIEVSIESAVLIQQCEVHSTRRRGGPEWRLQRAGASR